MQASSSSRSAKTREKHTSNHTHITTCGTTVPIEIENKIVQMKNSTLNLNWACKYHGIVVWMFSNVVEYMYTNTATSHHHSSPPSPPSSIITVVLQYPNHCGLAGNSAMMSGNCCALEVILRCYPVLDALSMKTVLKDLVMESGVVCTPFLPLFC